MVYVAVDYVDHGLPVWSLEALLGALRLSAIAGKDVAAVVVSPGPGPGPDELGALSASLSAYGIKSANLVAAEGYAPMVVEPLVDRLATVVRGLPPGAWVVPGTVDWRTAAARLAVRLDLSLAGEVVEFAHPGEGAGDLGPGIEVVRPVYGGNLMSREWIRIPCIVSVRAKAFTGEPEKKASTSPGSVAVQVASGPASVRGAGPEQAAPPRVLEVEQERQDFPPLEDAAVIVSGGRGLGGPAGFELLAELARAMGGSMGASRAAVDAGWAPYERQVGQSGRSVSPRLYLALGISGAAQHLAGMRGARAVVAVNRNPEAPFFARCTYGVVADWREFTEAMLAELAAPHSAG